MITSIGKRYILDYFANKTTSRTKYIAVGIGSDPASINDTKLHFETGRYPVISTSLDYVNSQIIYKAQLPVDLYSKISELGLYQDSGASPTVYDSNVVSFFDNDAEWSNGIIAPSQYSKVGESMFFVQTGNGTAVTTEKVKDFDFSGYSGNDKISVAFYQDANLSNFRLRLHTTSTDYYYYDFTAEASAGYYLKTISMSDIINNTNKQGSPTTDFEKMSIVVTPESGTVSVLQLDALRIDDMDIYTYDKGIISRSVITPVTKEFGRVMDVEYRMEMS